MKKSEILEHWQNLMPSKHIKPKPIPYGHRGSTFTQDSIRITGSQEYIDSILGNLKELLSYENDKTRLQVSYQEATDRETSKPTGTYTCYIQIVERGR